MHTMSVWMLVMMRARQVARPSPLFCDAGATCTPPRNSAALCTAASCEVRPPALYMDALCKARCSVRARWALLACEFPFTCGAVVCALRPSAAVCQRNCSERFDFLRDTVGASVQLIATFFCASVRDQFPLDHCA